MSERQSGPEITAPKPEPTVPGPPIQTGQSTKSKPSPSSRPPGDPVIVFSQRQASLVPSGNGVSQVLYPESAEARELLWVWTRCNAAYRRLYGALQWNRVSATEIDALLKEASSSIKHLEQWATKVHTLTRPPQQDHGNRPKRDVTLR